jgi:hypothetical protein
MEKCSDILDQAQLITQHQIDQQIAAARTEKRVQPTGECQWCSEPFEDNSLKLYCDADCSHDHEKWLRNN